MKKDNYHGIGNGLPRPNSLPFGEGWGEVLID